MVGIYDPGLHNVLLEFDAAYWPPVCGAIRCLGFSKTVSSGIICFITGTKVGNRSRVAPLCRPHVYEDSLHCPLKKIRGIIAI